MYQVCIRMVSVIQTGWRIPFMPCIELQGETGRILVVHSLFLWVLSVLSEFLRYYGRHFFLFSNFTAFV